MDLKQIAQGETGLLWRAKSRWSGPELGSVDRQPQSLRAQTQTRNPALMQEGAALGDGHNSEESRKRCSVLCVSYFL